jgi:hypothetical protein
LKARDAVLVSLKDMNGFVVWVVEVEDEDATVGTAGNEDIGDGIELKLADEGGVTLEEGEEFAVEAKLVSKSAMCQGKEKSSAPSLGAPDPHGRVARASDDLDPVEGDGVDCRDGKR